MPTTKQICYYAMYVIGEVESNWNWTSVNYTDPITIGMMQWYGTRAAHLLERVRDEMPDAYPTLSDSLRASLSAHSSSDGYWNSRYLTREEGNSIIEVFSQTANHVIQENQAIEDFENYIPILEGWGMSQSNPKALIFAMSMYHQGPKYAGQVVSTAGGTADLDRLWSVCLAHSVLGVYKNRYNTVHSRLVSWDGESNPPDFGQSGDADTGTGGDAGGIETGGGSKVGYILKNGNNLVLYGKDEYKNGVIFYASAGGRWINGYDADSTPDEGGNTGGGGNTGSGAGQQVCDKFKSWNMQFSYGQGAGRLDPESSGYGDCSSTIWRAYHDVTGVNTGTWTGDMLNHGTLIASGSYGQLPIEQMVAGDCILIDWPRNGQTSTFDHVELYVGNNTNWGHGGPGNGPHLTSEDTRNQGARYLRWQIRRYV